ncbi:MAG: cytochrome c oxidase assembly factor Coa1 family protein [Terriglobales bacterium]
MNTQPSRMPQSAVPAPVLSASPTQRGWLARNWKWLLATLFMGGLVLMVGFFALIMGAIRSSDVAQASMATAKSNRRVLQQLGAPIEEGWLLSGSVNVSNASGDADLSVPISGPKGKGTIYVTAHKSGGRWNYSLMQVAIDGSDERIDLLAAGAAPTQSNMVRPAQPQADQTTQPPNLTTVAAAAPPRPDAASFAAPASDVIQSQDMNTAGVVGEVIQCRRAEGVLSIRVRLRNNSSKEAKVYLVENSEYERIYVTAANKKYFILKDAEGTYLTPAADYNCGGRGVCARLGPGDTYTWWAKFPAPATDAKKLNLITPAGPPFEDIPITDK